MVVFVLIQFFKEIFGMDWSKWEPANIGNCAMCSSPKLVKSFHESGTGVRLKCSDCGQYHNPRSLYKETDVKQNRS